LRSPAIAIGLSKARRAGVDLKPPPRGKTSDKTRKAAMRDYARGHNASSAPTENRKRAAASLHAVEHEGQNAASSAALSQHARVVAAHRSAKVRSR
jgi:hypothetical protein